MLSLKLQIACSVSIFLLSFTLIHLWWGAHSLGFWQFVTALEPDWPEIRGEQICRVRIGLYIFEAFLRGTMQNSMVGNIIGVTGDVFVYPHYFLPQRLLWKTLIQTQRLALTNKCGEGEHQHQRHLMSPDGGKLIRLITWTTHSPSFIWLFDQLVHFLALWGAFDNKKK